jgi:Uma2 family endonuclease
MSHPDRRYTEAEYLALEDAAPYKSEYVNGRIYAMSGGSEGHNQIVFNLTGEVRGQIRGRPCRGFNESTRVRVTATGGYFYPDLSALCGRPEWYGEGAIKMLVNPSTIVEVLSPTTADFDRGDKFGHYRRIPALDEYLILEQDRVLAELRVRAGDVWTLRVLTGLDDVVELPSVGCALRLRDLYEGVEFPADAAPRAPRLLREEAAEAYAAGPA